MRATGDGTGEAVEEGGGIKYVCEKTSESSSEKSKMIFKVPRPRYRGWLLGDEMRSRCASERESSSRQRWRLGGFVTKEID